MAKTPQVFRYRIRNWRTYNRALINRGRLTVVWLDEQAVAAWRNTEPAVGPGAPRVYADLAIECTLVFKAVYHLIAVCMLVYGIPTMSEPSTGIRFRDSSQRPPNRFKHRLKGACFGVAQKGFALGPALFNWIEIGRIRRQV